MAILEVNNLKKIYVTRFGSNQVHALANINFSVEEGEYVAIMGESGSGKTTLLNILAALDRPTNGGWNVTTVLRKIPLSWQHVRPGQSGRPPGPGGFGKQ